MFALPRPWSFSPAPRSTARRRSANHFEMIVAEFLEDRQLLSASGSGTLESGVSAEVASVEQHAKSGSKKTPANLPDMTGHWNIVTHFPDGDIPGTLDLVQNGRKVTGTFTNEAQPPQKFVGKFENSKSDLSGILKGKTKNLSIASKQFVQFVADVIASVIEAKFHTRDGDVPFNGSKAP